MYLYDYDYIYIYNLYIFIYAYINHCLSGRSSEIYFREVKQDWVDAGEQMGPIIGSWAGVDEKSSTGRCWWA